MYRRKSNHQHGSPSSQLWLIDFKSAGLLSFPALLWLSIWLGINTGPGVLGGVPETLIGWAHFVRTLFPFLVISWFLLLFVFEKGMLRSHLPMNVIPWLLYGIICFLASIISPFFVDALYWGGVFLSSFAAMKLYLFANPGLKGIIGLSYLSWAIATVFFVILVIVAKDVLFVGAGATLSGYGIVNRISDVNGMAMSRSSGISRFAAIPGIVAFVFFLANTGKWKIAWLVVFLLTGGLIYLMQSRGAIFAFVIALAFSVLFYNQKSRLITVLCFFLIVFSYTFDMMPDKAIDQIEYHLLRGQDSHELATLTGRDRAWQEGWEALKESPITGFGFQADRFLIHEHIHNTYMYALLSGGFIGVFLFIIGLAWTWIIFFKLHFKKFVKNKEDKLFFIQSGALLVFFTVRSIPEVSGAMFGVDLMIMLPVIAYLGLLNQAYIREERLKKTIERIS